jgi:hypothetical protein
MSGGNARRFALPEKRRLLYQMIEAGEVTILAPPIDRLCGIGDVLAHSVGVKMLTAISGSAHVVFQTSPKLHKLFRSSFPGVELREDTHDPGHAYAAPTPDYRYGVPLFDLREMLRGDNPPLEGPHRRDGSGEPIPHLRANPELVEHYRRLLPVNSVGIVWSNGGGQRDYRSWVLSADVPIRGSGCDDGLWTCKP